MRRILPLLGLLFALSGLAFLAFRGTCSAQTFYPPASVTYFWDIGSSPVESYLYRNNAKLGTYNHATNKYFECFNGTCTVKVPPVPPPLRNVAPPQKRVEIPQAPNVIGQATMERGVDMSQISATERVTRRGQNASRENAIEAITGAPGSRPASDFKDDRDKLRVSVTGGTLPERQQVMAQLYADPFVKEKALVGEYDSDAWQLEPGFDRTGRQIIAELPDGKVVHRQTDWNVANAVGALRKAKPNYDPTKDPDLSKVLPNLLPGLKLPDLNQFVSNNWVLILGAIAAFLYFKGGTHPPAGPTPAPAV